MSKYLGRNVNDAEFDLGDYITFSHEGERLFGKVVRIYASRLLYHVEVPGGFRYEVSVPDDDPRKA